MTQFRVSLWDTSGTDRGRGNLVAVIDDALNPGVQTVANDAGLAFFTLPYNHPQIGQVVDSATMSPLLRHYEVARIAADGTSSVVGVGLLDDYDHTANEVVIYGRDYLSVLETTITASKQSYSSQTIGGILTSQLSTNTIGAAITEPNSRLGFFGLGTIDATTTTLPLIYTSFEPRLHFIRSVIAIWAADASVRPLISASRSSPWQFTFQQNAGSDKSDVRLEWGGNVTAFHYKPGWGMMRTGFDVVGQKRDGASVLYSEQTTSQISQPTYGWIHEGQVFIDITDQTALDQRARRAVRLSKNRGAAIALTLRSGSLAPWDGYDLMDSVPVYIKRGLVNLTGDLHTIWGLTWKGKPDGSEELSLILQPKMT